MWLSCGQFDHIMVRIIFLISNLFFITATGRPRSDVGPPTAKLEILPGFTEYFI